MPGCAVHISLLPKLCVKISILLASFMWVRSTRLTSVTFAEDKVRAHFSYSP